MAYPIIRNDVKEICCHDNRYKTFRKFINQIEVSIFPPMKVFCTDNTFYDIVINIIMYLRRLLEALQEGPENFLVLKINNEI